MLRQLAATRPDTFPEKRLATDTETAELQSLEEFIEEGYVSDVLTVIKRGKEAAAYLCRGTKKLGHDFAVAKVYFDSERRNFHSAAAYTEGRVIVEGHVRRAVENHSAAGKRIAASMWVEHEFETLSALGYAGCDVPEVFGSTGGAILMEYAGTEEAATPQLQFASMDREEAATVLDRVLWNIEAFMRENVIHGDLSAFNILYAGAGTLRVIDFPQAVDPRFSPSAQKLLERDLRNVGRYFGRYGLELDPERMARNLWNLWKFGDL